MSRDEGVLIENVGAAFSSEVSAKRIHLFLQFRRILWLAEMCTPRVAPRTAFGGELVPLCVFLFLDALNEGRSIVRHVQLRAGRCKHQEMKADFNAFELLVLNGTVREQEDHNVDADQHEGDDGPSPPRACFRDAVE